MSYYDRHNDRNKEALRQGEKDAFYGYRSHRYDYESHTESGEAYDDGYRTERNRIERREEERQEEERQERNRLERMRERRQEDEEEYYQRMEEDAQTEEVFGDALETINEDMGDKTE